jgi:hypothetical protein
MRDTCLMLIALTGCDDLVASAPESPCPPAFAQDETGECVFDEEAVADLMRSFADGDLVQINAEPFPQVTDSNVERNVYITPLFVAPGLDTVDLYQLVDPYRADDELPFEFPVGTAIVHERVDGLEGSTIQVKREEGFEGDEGRQWWFGKYWPDGEPDLVDCTPCILCHTETAHPGTEGLYGVPGDAR